MTIKSRIETRMPRGDHNSERPEEISVEGGRMPKRGRRNRQTAKTERTNVEFPLWRKKVDNSIFRTIEMLRYALENKIPILAQLAGYERRVLLLLNTYFFGDDIAAIETSLHQLIEENTSFSILDAVFYVTRGELHQVYEKHRN